MCLLKDKCTRIEWGTVRDLYLSFGFSHCEILLLVPLAEIHHLQHILHLNFGNVHNMWHLIKTVLVSIPSLNLRTMWKQQASDSTCSHWLTEHTVSSFSGLCSTQPHCGLYVDKISKKDYNLWLTVVNETVSCVHGVHVSHTGMLYATFVLADIRAQELLPHGAVQWEGHWQWSQTAFLAGGGSSSFSIPSHTAPILGLATVPLTG